MTDDELERLVNRLAVEFGHPTTPSSPYLDVKQAAAYCRCAVQTIYNNRRFIERLPGLRKLLFTREALDQWLTSRKRRQAS